MTGIRSERIFGVMCVLLGLSSVPAPAQTVTQATKVVQKQAAKVVKKVTRAVKHTNKQAVSTARGVTKSATNGALSALHNLPTPQWEKLKAAYDYPQDLPAIKEEPQERDDAMQINLSFTGPGGKPVAGIFLRPKADKVYPCALVLHGLTNNKEIALKMFSARLLKNGVAILALDAPEHGASQPKNKSYWNKQVIQVAVHEGTRNYREALDWLTKRDDIDPARIGALGYSLGSITSVILGSVDTRVSAFSLCVGGDPFLVVAQAMPTDRDAVFAVCPSLFAPHLAGRPILFQNGRKDVVIVPPAAMILHNAAKGPKTVAWYNGGHDLPDAIRARAVDWLVKKLAAMTPTTSPDAADKPNPEPPPKTKPDAPAPPPDPK